MSYFTFTFITDMSNIEILILQHTNLNDYRMKEIGQLLKVCSRGHLVLVLHSEGTRVSLVHIPSHQSWECALIRITV